MTENTINKKIILDRINTIQSSLEKLESLQKLDQGKFMIDENFAIAEHYLRYALEATFDICTHILANIPDANVDEYKKIALEMGKKEIVPLKFAQENLFKMAGYRNRLTHFYFEITPQEMYQIVQKNLDDFKTFLKHIKNSIEKNII